MKTKLVKARTKSDKKRKFIRPQKKIGLASNLYTLGILFLILIALFTSVYFKRHGIACALIPYMDYQAIQHNSYANVGLSKNQYTAFKALINSASGRIENTYGEPISKPIILFTSKKTTAAKWGANETATLHRTPWQTCIIVGPYGENTDVLAHEWLHAEIQERVGFLRIQKEMPIWFDEGAALTLDYREPYQPIDIHISFEEVSRVQNLVNGNKFYSGDIVKNYQAARMAVIPLIRKEYFYKDLEKISKGQSFNQVFMNKVNTRKVNTP